MANNDSTKICSILAWFFPIGLIWYLVDEKMKKSKFVKFHVQQSLVLAIVGIIFSIIGVFVGFIAWIPFIGWLIGRIWLILSYALYIFLFVLWIIGLISAIQGKEKELPIIGKYGKKFKL